MLIDWPAAIRIRNREHAELCHLRQQCATLAGELQQAREQVAAQAAQIAALQDALCGAMEGKAFYEQAFSDKCKEAKR